jgi:hypothetical protein
VRERRWRRWRWVLLAYIAAVGVATDEMFMVCWALAMSTVWAFERYQDERVR